MENKVKVFDRQIFWSGEVGPELAIELAPEIVKLDSSEGDITLHFLSSEGGCSSCCSALTDLILHCNNKVISIAYGNNSSSAAIMFLASDERVMMPQATLMFHEGSVSIESTPSGIKTLSEVIEKERQLDIEFLVKRSNKNVKYWEERFRQGDFYLFVEEAVELGIVTHTLSK